MKKTAVAIFIGLFIFAFAFGQAGRVPTYSESVSATDKNVRQTDAPKTTEPEKEKTKEAGDDVIRVETDLIIIPAQISDRQGKPVGDIKREEFRIFENDTEQEIAYFSGEEQPFTVALVLDMSYSSVFKLSEIQAAALAFVNQLREKDKVMVVSFDEKARVLCEPTGDRKILRLAIEGARIASGTSLYLALDLVLNEKFSRMTGRKAIVLLSDGVDTQSRNQTAAGILREAAETDVLIYPIQYDTYDDVQKTRRENAQVLYDDNDRPYVVEAPRVRGEREEDYRAANEFLKTAAIQTGGKVYRVSSATDLNQAFARIADELRKIYSLGYYPSGERQEGARYSIKVRVYRPNLAIRARSSYVWKRNSKTAR